MEFIDIEKLVISHNKLPKYTDMYVKLAYYELNCLYLQYRQGKRLKEDCTQIKVKIKKEFETNKKNNDILIKKMQRDNILKATREIKTSAITRQKDKEKKLELCLKYIADEIGQDIFYRQNID